MIQGQDIMTSKSLTLLSGKADGFLVYIMQNNWLHSFFGFDRFFWNFMEWAFLLYRFRNGLAETIAHFGYKDILSL